MIGGVTACSLGAAFWDDLLGTPAAARGGGAFGPLGRRDGHGLELARGFEARLIARGGQRVGGTSYRWHEDSDGAATFASGDGFVLVSNSGSDDGGGASAIGFDRRGRIEDACAC